MSSPITLGDVKSNGVPIALRNAPVVSAEDYHGPVLFSGDAAADLMDRLFIPNVEADRPETVRRFTAEVAGVPAVLFVTPEHNRSLPAVLKNAIDWGSKPTDKQVWRDRVAAITGTSFGGHGCPISVAT